MQSFPHTPASCHSLRRRQHVMPEPQPISWGSISQGMPVLRTNRIPVRAARASMRGLPPLGLGGSSGKSGSITSHSSSVTSGLAIFSSYPPPGFVRRTKVGLQDRKAVSDLVGVLVFVLDVPEVFLPGSLIA